MLSLWYDLSYKTALWHDGYSENLRLTAQVEQTPDFAGLQTEWPAFTSKTIPEQQNTFENILWLSFACSPCLVCFPFTDFWGPIFFQPVVVASVPLKEVNPAWTTEHAYSKHVPISFQHFLWHFAPFFHLSFLSSNPSSAIAWMSDLKYYISLTVNIFISQWRITSIL